MVMNGEDICITGEVIFSLDSPFIITQVPKEVVVTQYSEFWEHTTCVWLPYVRVTHKSV